MNTLLTPNGETDFRWLKLTEAIMKVGDAYKIKTISECLGQDTYLEPGDIIIVTDITKQYDVIGCNEFLHIKSGKIYTLPAHNHYWSWFNTKNLFILRDIVELEPFNIGQDKAPAPSSTVTINSSHYDMLVESHNKLCSIVSLLDKDL